MDTSLVHQRRIDGSRRPLHSIRQHLVGFLWAFCASLLLVVGGGLAALGIGGGLLVRARPDTSNVINYDPSTVAFFAPLPLAAGMLLTLWFVLRARRYRR